VVANFAGTGGTIDWAGEKNFGFRRKLGRKENFFKKGKTAYPANKSRAPRTSFKERLEEGAGGQCRNKEGVV